MDMTMPMTPMTSGGLFGGNGGDWTVFLLFALIFGWGGAGNGLFGGRGGFGDRALSEEFNTNNIINGIRGLERGLCDLGYQGSQETASVVNAITQSAFANERGMADLGRQLADCCCSNKLAISELNNTVDKRACDIITAGNMNTRDIIANNTANTQRIIDMMTQSEINALRDRNQELALQVSQSAQTQAIVQALQPKAPIPAYVVPSPFCNGVV